MESESHFCGWHLPPIDKKVVETESKIKCTHQRVMNKMKFKTKTSEEGKFRHFSDAEKYIDEYRKKHTFANASLDWEEGNMQVHRSTKTIAEDDKFSKFIDIRVPEKKICLTGLPQLKPPPKHVLRTRGIHERNEGNSFLTGVPHLPHLTLNGATKTVVKRDANRTEGQKHKRAHRKKTQARLPYLKPPELEL